MGYHTTSETDDERTVSEGDSVIFSGSGDRTEGEVTNKYDDGSFMVEWTSNGEERGQIFRPKVFDRSAFVDHEPKEEQGA